MEPRGRKLPEALKKMLKIPEYSRSYILSKIKRQIFCHSQGASTSLSSRGRSYIFTMGWLKTTGQVVVVVVVVVDPPHVILSRLLQFC